MRILLKSSIVCTLFLFFGLQAQSLDSNTFMTARQAELERYGRLLFNVDFADGHWTHRPLSGCSLFTHHAFAVYERTERSSTDRFLVIYNLNTPPARSMDRPWEGGIVAAHLGSEWGTSSGTRPDEAELIVFFNRVLADERHTLHSTSALPASAELADCFTELAGEFNMRNKPSDQANVSASGPPISNIVSPIKSSSAMKRFQVIHFDRHGLIEDAHVSVAID